MIKNGHLSAVFLPRKSDPARSTCQATTFIVLALLFCVSAHSQTANAPAAPEPSPTRATEGGELQQITVTGYLIPRVGEGPQPVANYDRNYIDKTGSQTVNDVLQNLPAAVGNFLPAVTTGFSFSPGSSSVGLKGLPPNDSGPGRRPSLPPISLTASYLDLNH
jgi:hypothetical protein